ncbi:MAG: hypothetical protein LM583_01070 [Desulfurococcaceae archaeon]|jgi:hypothetical protein|nr:hypothetical protein [Desulfurococcaceae archaeon]
MSSSRCIEYKLVDTDRGVVVREASACSEEEFRIVEHLVDLVNKKFKMSIRVVVKNRTR